MARLGGAAMSRAFVVRTALGISCVLSVLPALAQKPERPQGEKYALLVGVRQYDPNELRSLPYSEADAEGLAKVFLASGYKPRNVVLMTQRVGAEKLRFLPVADRIRQELKLLVD